MCCSTGRQAKLQNIFKAEHRRHESEREEALDRVIGLATLETNNRNQRKLSVTYWNDEELAYKHAQMYMTDTEYSIHTVDETDCDIEYNSFTIELIEY